MGLLTGLVTSRFHLYCAVFLLSVILVDQVFDLPVFSEPSDENIARAHTYYKSTMTSPLLVPVLIPASLVVGVIGILTQAFVVTRSFASILSAVLTISGTVIYIVYEVIDLEKALPTATDPDVIRRGIISISNTHMIFLIVLLFVISLLTVDLMSYDASNTRAAKSKKKA